MIGSNLKIIKGKLFVYRIYDISHEINLKQAQICLEKMTGSDSVRRYELKKDPLRKITMREVPLILSGGEEDFNVYIDNKLNKLKLNLEIKIWDYGALSLSYKIDISNLSWKELISLGSILESESYIDRLSKFKKDEISRKIKESLSGQYNHDEYEDYITYVIEEVEERAAKCPPKKIKNPIDLIKSAPIPELLLAETAKSLSDSTKKSVLANLSQYTNKDALILDWNSSLIIDFTKEKEYKEYLDIIEFSITQLLELRIYDQILDERLEELYRSIETNKHSEITDFYSKLSTESGQLYLEFSDFFEKLDGSIKTAGDFYSSKVLKSAGKRLGFNELKQTMSRKIEMLSKLSKMLQSKVDSLVDEKRNQIGEDNIKKSHKVEVSILILIIIEAIPTLKEFYLYLISRFNY